MVERTVLQSSRKAAQEYSPRRKPWVKVDGDPAPKGRKTSSHAHSLAPEETRRLLVRSTVRYLLSPVHHASRPDHWKISFTFPSSDRSNGWLSTLDSTSSSCSSSFCRLFSLPGICTRTST